MVADRGRQPGFGTATRRVLAFIGCHGVDEICAGMFSVAEILDREGGKGYVDAIQ